MPLCNCVWLHKTSKSNLDKRWKTWKTCKLCKLPTSPTSVRLARPKTNSHRIDAIRPSRWRELNRSSRSSLSRLSRDTVKNTCALTSVFCKIFEAFPKKSLEIVAFLYRWDVTETSQFGVPILIGSKKRSPNDMEIDEMISQSWNVMKMDWNELWEYMGMGWNNEITFCLGVENPFLSPTNRLCSSRPVNSFAKTSNLNDFEVRMFSTYFKFSFDVQRRRHSQNRPVRRRQCGKSLRFHVSECLVRQLLLKHRCESGLSAKLKRLVCRLANGTRIRH